MEKKNFSKSDGNMNSRKSGSGDMGQLLSGMGFQVGKKGPHAPYNFVPAYPKVMEGTPQVHDIISSGELYSGYITYRVTAQTPLMIDDGSGAFYRSADGTFAIPGSTVRGLIRNHVQILGFADTKKDVDDYYLMYRAVASGCQKDDYAKVLGAGVKFINGRRMSVLKNVKAGYIKREGKKYYLYRNVGDTDGTFRPGDTDYYVVSERYVLEKAGKDFAYILRDNGSHLQNFPPFREFRDRSGKKQYIGRENKNYVPYYEKITYSTANGKVTGIAKSGLKRTGTVLSSGFIGKKKAFYVIPEANLSSRKEIPEETIQAFQADYNRRKNGLKKETRAFFDLPADGEIRPVFYIELEGRLYIGYTPRLRLMYRYSILGGKGQSQGKRPACDYAEAMFGYATDEKACKSRISFTDARLINGRACRRQDQDSLILAEPKPTSYLEYLKQPNVKKIRTYNDSDFELRGVKQYWLQEKVQKNPEGASANEKIRSKIAPIEAGSEFAGTVRFHNLTESELGLLLWSIRLEKDSQINLGKAKAYGYGRARLDQTVLYLQNSRKAYDLTGEIFGADPFERQSDKIRDMFVDAYQKTLAAWLGGKGQTDREILMANPSIRDFFRMRTTVKEGRDVAYMTLEEFTQYKQKNNPLPEVGSV